jgi:hypothetical protein
MSVIGSLMMCILLRRVATQGNENLVRVFGKVTVFILEGHLMPKILTQTSTHRMQTEHSTSLRGPPIPENHLSLTRKGLAKFEGRCDELIKIHVTPLLEKEIEIKRSHITRSHHGLEIGLHFVQLLRVGEIGTLISDHLETFHSGTLEPIFIAVGMAARSENTITLKQVFDIIGLGDMIVSVLEHVRFSPYEILTIYRERILESTQEEYP